MGSTITTGKILLTLNGVITAIGPYMADWRFVYAFRIPFILANVKLKVLSSCLGVLYLLSRQFLDQGAYYTRHVLLNRSIPPSFQLRKFLLEFISLSELL